MSELAEGRWLHIFADLAPELSPAISNLGGPVPCPVHGGSDGFRLFGNAAGTGGGVCNTCGTRPTGVRLLAWLKRWPQEQAVKNVGNNLGLVWETYKQGDESRPELGGVDLTEYTEKQRLKDVAAVKALLALHTESAPIDWRGENPATRWFKNRGLEAIFDDPPQDLRLHPGLSYWGQQKVRDAEGNQQFHSDGSPVMKPLLVGKWPAIIACVRAPTGNIIGLHRIWVTESGHKPDLSHPMLDEDGDDEKKKKAKHKKLAAMPSFLTISGAAIRLYNATRVLGVGEGIETILSARVLMEMRQGRKLPVWAGISTSGIASMEIPEYVDELLGFADNDPIPKKARNKTVGPGEEYMIKLRDRHLDRGGMRIHLAPKVGTDWNDVLMSQLKRREAINDRFAESYMSAGAFEAYQQAKQAALQSSDESHAASAPSEAVNVPAAAPSAPAPVHDEAVPPGADLDAVIDEAAKASARPGLRSGPERGPPAEAAPGTSQPSAAAPEKLPTSMKPRIRLRHDAPYEWVSESMDGPK